jgi:hypothetical protein
MRVFQILVGSLAITMCLQCANSQIALQELKQNGFSVIDFPEPFLRNDPTAGRILVTFLNYEIRKSSNPPGNELLFGLKDYNDAYSDKFFGVSIDGRFKVRAASADEWNRAEPLQTKRYDPYAHEARVHGDPIEYRGRAFKKTGRSWESTAALPSPNGKWLAVFSHTGEKDLPS